MGNQKTAEITEIESEIEEVKEDSRKRKQATKKRLESLYNLPAEEYPVVKEQKEAAEGVQ